jgi:hypothetical protein
VADIESASFSRILLENSSITRGISNVILHIGNTMSNHDYRVQVLKNLRSDMSRNDIIILTISIDTEDNRQILNNNKEPSADPQTIWLLKELGIDVDKCEINTTYQDSTNSRIKTLKLDKDYTISFDLLGEVRELNLRSGEKITTLKLFLITETQFQEELKLAGLKLLSYKLDKALNTGLFICKIDIK